MKINENINEDNFNRLAKAIMEKYQCSYPEALSRLNRLQLNLVCSIEIQESLPLQAALLTAVNCGKRAFLGGVYIVMPEKVNSLIKWPQVKTLNEILEQLGAIIIEKPINEAFTLAFGLRSLSDGSLEVVCNDWVGGFAIEGEDVVLAPSTSKLPLGGIAAGSLSVGAAFFKVTGVSITACDQSIGISLWRPDLNWLDKLAQGPMVLALPQKYWLLGLGHLGQAFAWTISMLPYQNPNQVGIWVQDDDKITEANQSGGLLSDSNNENHYKTRACSVFLEERGFTTNIIEKRFDEHTKRKGEEPWVALCGFDKAEGRRALEKAGFAHIVEVALGGELSLFDNIILHTFPNGRRTAEAIWINRGGLEISSEHVLKEFEHLSKNGCGVLADTLSKTAISSSFVGALASTLAIGELVRGMYPSQGMRYDTMVVQVRNLDLKRAVVHPNQTYSTEMALNGFVSA